MFQKTIELRQLKSFIETMDKYCKWVSIKLKNEILSIVVLYL